MIISFSLKFIIPSEKWSDNCSRKNQIIITISPFYSTQYVHNLKHYQILSCYFQVSHLKLNSKRNYLLLCIQNCLQSLCVWIMRNDKFHYVILSFFFHIFYNFEISNSHNNFLLWFIRNCCFNCLLCDVILKIFIYLLKLP